MAVTGVHPPDGRSIIYIKGSIEAVLDRCQFYFVSENSTPGLDAATRSMLLERATSVASRGLRVLAMAYGYGNYDATHPPTSHNLIFTGFQAMYDPPRPGVKEAIAKLHAGGVKVIMITGDAEHTALAIAKELGLKVLGGRSCLTGAEIDTMTEREVGDRITRGVSVFARVTPRHKMIIVGALQSRGDVVGMTGDGVNDAPALKMADIGTSMGKSGTDVAKEAADVILVDDNFATLLSAVEEGKSNCSYHIPKSLLNFACRKIHIPQHSKFPVVPTEYGGCSTELDHTQHGVPPQQPTERDANTLHQYPYGRCASGFSSSPGLL
jgi:Ca2+-transporting ATPase